MDKNLFHDRCKTNTSQEIMYVGILVEIDVCHFHYIVIFSFFYIGIILENGVVMSIFNNFLLTIVAL